MARIAPTVALLQELISGDSYGLEFANQHFKNAARVRDIADTLTLRASGTAK